jgi:hypothetical protein
MAYIGKVPTAVPLATSDLADNIVTVDKLADTLDLSSNTITLPSGVGGKVLQIVQTEKTDFYSQTVASWTDITGLSVQITPTSASNKIYVQVVVNASKQNGGGNSHLRLLRDSTVVGTGTAGSSYNGFGMTDQAVDYNTMSAKVNNYLDSPSSTSQLTYKVQLYNITTGYTAYVNRRHGGTGHGANSTITVMEIAG